MFIRRKLGQEKVTYPHPSLQEVLEPTYGVITYQEQVMRIANVLAGFSLAEADVLRKAVGKKDAELIKQELGKFVSAPWRWATRRSWWTSWRRQIETFGRYGFNKSHSVAYSVLSYQTAWLKAHYPAEFMAALLSSEIGNTDKVVQYINEARELGLEMLPPDVNESGFKFTVVGDGASGSAWARCGTWAGAPSSRSSPARQRAVHSAGRPGGADRPPAVQQAGARVAGRGRARAIRWAATGSS